MPEDTQSTTSDNPPDANVASTCQNCNRPSNGKTRCTRCMGYCVKSARTKRERYRAEGRCPTCGVYTSNNTCDSCLLKKRLYKQTARWVCIQAYGGACACCGERRLEFLQIDHVDTPGHIERADAKAKGLPVHLYVRLKKLGYPSGFRVLCANCNMALAFYGYCPHHPESKRRVRGRHAPRRLPVVAPGESLLEHMLFKEGLIDAPVNRNQAETVNSLPPVAPRPPGTPGRGRWKGVE